MDLQDQSSWFLLRSIRAVRIQNTYGGAADFTVYTPTSSTRYWVVLNASIASTAGVTLTWKGGTSGAMTGDVPIAANTRIDWLPNLAPLWKAQRPGETLVLAASAATTASGWVTVIETNQ